MLIDMIKVTIFLDLVSCRRSRDRKTGKNRIFYETINQHVVFTFTKIFDVL